MSSQRIRRTALLAAGLALTACASTSLVQSWKAPEAGPLRFNKVLALAVLNNESVRTLAEDSLRANLKGVQAVQGYKLVSTAELGNLQGLKARLLQEGFDGVVVLRLASTQQELTWTTAYVPLDTFIGYPPTDMSVDTVVRVEIKVYSLAEDKLMWSGVSETFNPKNAGQLVADIVAAAGREMRRQGLLKA